MDLTDAQDQNAQSIVEEGLRLLPGDPRLLYWRGAVLEFRAVWVGVQATDTRSSTMAARDGSGFDLIANARLWGPVEDAYRNVVQRDPAAYEAHVHLGFALASLRKETDARSEYELARRHATDPYVIYIANLLLARLDEAQDLINDAAACYERAVATMPDAQSAYVGLSALEARRGNIDRARSVITRLAAIPAKARAVDPWWSYHGTRVPAADLQWLREAVHP